MIYFRIDGHSKIIPLFIRRTTSILIYIIEYPTMVRISVAMLESIKLKANHYFTTSKNEATLQRRTLQFFVTDLLMDAGQYRGFNYLRKHDVENGLTYGVEWNDTGDKATFKDESRIFFH